MTDKMAEYGKPGASVYVLDCDHGVKVGLSGNLPVRLADLERALGFAPVLFRSWFIEKPGRAYHVEQGAHWLLRDCRTKGEWFHCHPLEAVDAVERSVRAPLRYLVEKDGLAA